MADRLHFSLVSPERELFSGEAESVLVPGAEGLFQVMVGSAPIMSTLSPGFVVIDEGSSTKRIYVRGGFADVTAAGLTILAEVAVPESELTGDRLAAEKATIAAQVADGGLSPEDRINADRAAALLRTV
ncbi:ATP synthase F1 subunit epsilon [Parvularcula sp. LCG005]|uniref:ATP synthase F1 subunit epsilon n=1 Tax=Parvularcula sp. LCG005 TaxID=3078805 RepID=UPI0029434EB4|nr:ATP synthase F1 subunit epsilon [Parvularcula sp. LCG005]WOI53074.1 ATP synthase F1 subunit epsilon [Parvularcula sp. LCG005]